MPRVLRNLRINEVSGVDKGAGRGVKIMLMKRDGTIDWDAVKRDVSDKERENLADKGKALPDGSFPIANVGDLKNAIQAIGRAKNPAKAKAHIKSRARALGQSDLIPDTWKRESDIAALEALHKSIASIAGDEAVLDKLAAVNASIDQFNEFVKENDHMTTQDEINKAMLAGLKELGEKIEKLGHHDDGLEKMSERHKAFHSKITDDGDKKKFAAATPGERDEMMDKLADKYQGSGNDEDESSPPPKKGSHSSNKREDDIQKALAPLQKENAELRKIANELIGDKRKAEFQKRAVESGLKEIDGDVMLKAFDGDPEAQGTLLKRFTEEQAALRAQLKTNVIFKEFGHTGTTQGSAYGQLEAKAAELRKQEPKLTPAQAFSKVYTDPANRELVQLEKMEKDQRLAKIAAGTGI